MQGKQAVSLEGLPWAHSSQRLNEAHRLHEEIKPTASRKKTTFHTSWVERRTMNGGGDVIQVLLAVRLELRSMKP